MATPHMEEDFILDHPTLAAAVPQSSETPVGPILRGTWKGFF